MTTERNLRETVKQNIAMILIGRMVSGSRSGKYRVIVEGESTFYPQVKGWLFWHPCERWGKSEMDCYFDTMEKALKAIEEHKRQVAVSRIKKTIVPV